jgi:hypothetical protein
MQIFYVPPMATLAPMALCECGCGEPAPIATQTDNARGVSKGQPCRFISGHHLRVRDWQESPHPRQVVITLRMILAQLRMRGMPFDEAWPLAVHKALGRSSGGDHKHEWQYALRSTQDVWRDAYDRTGQRLDVLAMLMPLDEPDFTFDGIEW